MEVKMLMIIMFFLYKSQGIESSNILGIFPHHGYSHYKVFYPILRELAQRGHTVTIVTYFRANIQNANITELLLTGKSVVNVFKITDFSPTRSLLSMFNEFMSLHREGQDSCGRFYESDVIQKIMYLHSKDPYQLAIMENFNTDCYFGVTHLLQIPVIGISSCALMPWHYNRLALPDTPSYIQTEFVGFPERMNWQQRLVNFIVTKTSQIMYRYYTNKEDNKFLKKFLNISEDVYDLTKDSLSLMFINQHYSLSGNRPSSPQLIEIGGIHIDDSKIQGELPERINSFLEHSRNGVLLISWGSMLQSSSLPYCKLDTIISVLQQLPIRVIWKWEGEPPMRNKNILFVKWAPQLRLLCHPNVKLFWGHGGLLGITESIYCGKPMMITPIYGDQFLNAYAVVNRGAGNVLFYDDINKVKLLNALREIMSPSVSKMAAITSEIFRNRQVKPMETAVWWVEHILRFRNRGSSLLKTESFYINWFCYHSLDTITVLLLLFGAVITFVSKIAKVAIRSITKNVKQKLHKE